jgi:hypothetical protein
VNNKEKLHLIVCCRHPEILDTLIRVINHKTIYTAEGCYSVNQLADLSFLAKANMILIGSGFTEEEEIQLEALVHQLKPGTPVVFHYGGGSGLLHAEIISALSAGQSLSLG